MVIEDRRPAHDEKSGGKCKARISAKMNRTNDMQLWQ
jgi:hypothetical protein